MKLGKLLKGLELNIPEGREEIEITGIAYDSRLVKKGNLFVCIKGYKSDGHEFAAAAIEKGAICVIAEEGLPVEAETNKLIFVKDTRKALSKISANYYENPSEKLCVFGVTGTNGKTTTTYMLKNIIEEWGKKTGIIGTIGYQTGKTEYESVNTTPGSLELSRMFSEMLEEGNEYCVMEVSSHSLALDRVADVKFNYAIFTNLTPDHLDFHTDFEDYYQSKKILFKLVENKSLINIDDKYGKRLYQELLEEGKNPASFSTIVEDADYFSQVEDRTDTYSIIKIISKGTEIAKIRINIPGNFSVYNALGAFSAAFEAGVPSEVIVSGIEKLGGVPGRFELIKNDKNVVVIVDYAHTPDALDKVLKTARDFKKGRLICVFGCGGDRDKTKRPMMGRTAGELADYCIITSDNPRTEDPIKILGDVEEGIYGTGCVYEVIEDRYEAIKKALTIYRKGDVVIVAGKGHEDYQIIGTEKHHFDDREVIREILK